MATMQKLEPCPHCGSAEYLAIYKYENGWVHVECDECFYLGAGAGNKIDAVRLHNDEFETRKAGYHSIEESDHA